MIITIILSILFGILSFIDVILIYKELIKIWKEKENEEIKDY